MAGSGFRQRPLELLEQIALLLSELDRRFDLYMHVKIARSARAQSLDTLATQPERLARLRAFRHGETCAADQRRHVDLTAKRRRREGNCHLPIHLISMPFEHPL